MPKRLLLYFIGLISIHTYPCAQVVEVVPVFPKVSDNVTIAFNATEGNGALTGVSPVYSHTEEQN